MALSCILKRVILCIPFVQVQMSLQKSGVTLCVQSGQDAVGFIESKPGRKACLLRR